MPVLDVVTGLADSVWFEQAVAWSEDKAQHGAFDVGIIAVHLGGVRHSDSVDEPEISEGVLLLAAEVLHTWAASDDVAARVGAADFAVITRADAAGLELATAALRTLLLDAGVSARVGSAMRSRQQSLAVAVRAAAEEVRTSRLADAAAQPGDVVAARSAMAAAIARAQACGILMQWHHCSYERASVELGYQAYELGLPVTAMGRLLIAVAGRESVAEDAARGIELHRSLRLAAHVQSRVCGVRSRDAAPAFMSEFGPTFEQTQPVWTVGTPNGATGLLTLRPDDLPAAASTLELAGRYQAAVSRAGSGGDWFDAFLLPDGSAALIVGDVAGHSTVAAAAMLQLRTLVRDLLTVDALGGPAVGEVLTQVDHHFGQIGLELLATVFVGLLRTDDDGGITLQWCNAGHLPPLLLTADGATVFLPSADDLLLGCDQTARRTTLMLALPSGSTLLLYSDGLVEDRVRALDDGLARLAAAVRARAGQGVAALCDGLLGAMVDLKTPDDVTLLGVRLPAVPRP